LTQSSRHDNIEVSGGLHVKVTNIIGVIIALVLLLAPGQATATTTTTRAATTTAATTTVTLSEQITQLAKLYKVNANIASRIIWCESKDNQEALRLNRTSGGIVWSRDIGMWQLNSIYQEPTAKKMGLNIYNEEDNLIYGFWLMSKEGTRPWNWSRKCWS
jgi:hypothetical protein